MIRLQEEMPSLVRLSPTFVHTASTTIRAALCFFTIQARIPSSDAFSVYASLNLTLTHMSIGSKEISLQG